MILCLEVLSSLVYKSCSEVLSSSIVFKSCLQVWFSSLGFKSCLQVLSSLVQVQSHPIPQRPYATSHRPQLTNGNRHKVINVHDCSQRLREPQRKENEPRKSLRTFPLSAGERETLSLRFPCCCSDHPTSPSPVNRRRIGSQSKQR